MSHTSFPRDFSRRPDQSKHTEQQDPNQQPLDAKGFLSTKQSKHQAVDACKGAQSHFGWKIPHLISIIGKFPLLVPNRRN